MKLDAWRPDADGLTTFPGLRKRLDWILVSEELEFKSSEVLPDEVSDHLGVKAEIGLKSKSSEKS
jgi:endonuclease/exonuclease/phosphatase family metal-dependent hydrolase